MLSVTRSTRAKSTRGLLALGLAVAALSAAAGAATSGGPRGRVVVLGFDGADHRLTERFLAEGKLPNLAKLAQAGGFSPLRPTIPAQTPVSWSTFTTGLSPGRTQIFDFLKRDPKTYRPEFAVAEEGRKPFLFGKRNRLVVPAALAAAAFLAGAGLGRLGTRKRAVVWGAAVVLGAAAGGLGWRVAPLLPEEIPTVTNNRRGTPFWEAAARRGVKSVVMQVPVTFPAADYEGGKLVSGLGVPDVRGRIGTPSFYTSDPFFAPKNRNEFSVELVRLEANTGDIRTEVFGPYNKLFGEPPVIKVPMTLTVAPDGGSLRVAPAGSEAVTLKPGDWSPWVRFTFPFNALVKLSGIGRFHLAAIKPEIQLYLSPINFDPVKLPPGVKISAPAGLAASLAKKYGLFKTMGWTIDTWSMSEEVIDEPTFLEDVRFTTAQFRRMMNGLLDENPEIGLFVQIYEFTDRVGHVMWRLLDPEHPAYDAGKAEKYAGSVEESYREMDAIVGDVMKRLRPEDLLLVVSDHGFATWRRSINYNTFLVENGYMVLTGDSQTKDLEALFGKGEFWPNVDWSKTRAYAMGLGEIYLNVKGREAKGIVAPGAEYEAVRTEIAAKLKALVDPKTGKKPVANVYTREAAYGSFDADVIPDLFVTNSVGYRIAWQGSLGVVTKELYEDNAQIWSGDHCSVDPDLVPGILFANRPLPKDRRPGIADVPATVLEALGTEPPEKLDGTPLF